MIVIPAEIRMSEKVVYIISDIERAISFEWIASYINKDLVTLSFIFLNPAESDLERALKAKCFEVHSVVCRGKKDWPGATHKVYKLLKMIRPNAIHCHLIQANVIGLVAARLAGIKQRIYTRHHSSLHHIYFPKGVWWDKLANKLATDIVAISPIVEKILLEWEQVLSTKVKLIPHGFLLDQFANVSEESIASFKSRYNLEGCYPVVGVISRLTEWKGVQYIIPAFKQLIQTYPNSVLLLLNAHGDYEKEIFKQLEELPSESYRIIKFESNIAAAYKCMDIFVHVPIDEHSEAFGQIYIEALAAQQPCIFTKSGIATDFIVDGKNAFVAPFKDSAAIYDKMIFILNNSQKANEIAKQGALDVMTSFSINTMITSLEKLYVQY